MNRMRQAISSVLVIALVSLGMTAQAQRRAYRMSDRQVGELIRRVETDADEFRRNLDAALDRSRYNRTGTEDNINAYVSAFENATDQLRARFDARTSVAADVENVLRAGANIDAFMRNNRLNARTQNSWSVLRSDLDALASAYSVAWNWNQSTLPTTVAGRPYRMTDREVDTIIRRVETTADRFRTVIANSLDRSRRYDGTRAEDDINAFVQNFENATDQLRTRFNNRQSVAADVENVLRAGASIDAFMRNNRLPMRATNAWTNVRTELNALASAYSVAWNWDNTNTFPSTTGGFGNYNTNGRLTGTFRLDPSRSDDARAVADRVTRNLPSVDRQRVYDRVLARLESPTELAIERRGMSVQIASSRAPQTTFEADGRERTEQMPNGRISTVRATFSGDQLVVSSTGYRDNDFTVTFEPIDGGRGLRVTRRIFNERLGANPVVVQNYYERTSDVARFDIYNGTQGFPTNTVGSTGDYVVTNGETLVAVLDTDLTTRDTQNGDRFRMTVREPARYSGAVIEGTVSNVNRSGRVTGRSEISLNFDSIRMPNGQTYAFAGFIDSVRTVNGDTIAVDNEGTVRDDNQTEKTIQRAAIGTAVGAIIGAIAGGGKGAAIGAVLGGGAGAGSVYVQGQNDLNLLRGSEVTIRASAPR
ncbi:MAG TPA: YMGG-like glycine zipper-containing protein [Pyrinomonadaceae bacterium]|nr:YMGG-like glycine zipper-containing protein [Pyrinomonadaceae bacterium]